MVENLPSSSKRERALRRWLMALSESGRAVAEAPRSNPERASEMECLLRQSHGPAARALAAPNAPMFRARIPASGAFKRGRDVRVLRIPFGIFSSAGRERMRLVTVYQVEPCGVLATLTESDMLWEVPAKLLKPWEGIDPRPSQGLGARLEAVSAELQRWYLAFQNSNDFLTWRKQTSSQYAEERRQLSVMYSDYSLTQLFGLQEEPDGFRPTLDDEYRRRLLDLAERYEAGFRAIPLSVSEIRCSALSLKPQTLRVPFISEPIVTSAQDDFAERNKAGEPARRRANRIRAHH
jgi:hypothetical protein